LIVRICDLHCRTKRQSVVKLCLPQALFYT